MSTENQIQLKGEFRREEAVAAGVISPGHLTEINAAGKVVVHATEGGQSDRTFAIEDALQGKGLDDDYAVDDRVSLNVQHVGSEVQGILKAGENVAIGAFLISAGDGTLIANGSESSGVTIVENVAEVKETKDLSGSGAVDTLIQILVL